METGYMEHHTSHRIKVRIMFNEDMDMYRIEIQNGDKIVGTEDCKDLEELTTVALVKYNYDISDII